MIMAIEENSGWIQSTLGKILSRFDAQAERLERLSSEVRNLGQQGSLDEVKRTQVQLLRQPPLPPPPPPPRLKLPQEPDQVTIVIPLGALTNHGPPLLTNPQGLSVSYEVDTTPASPAESVGYTKPPKLDFPRFFGENPRLWLDRC